jgi:hypothetical protein
LGLIGTAPANFADLAKRVGKIEDPGNRRALRAYPFRAGPERYCISVSEN